jgi:hypothetical protein
MNSLRERVASASSSAARSKTGFFFLPGAESQSAEEKQNVVPRVVVTDPRGARRPTRVGARALEPRARRLRTVPKEGPSVGSSRRGQARAEAPEVACRRHPSAAADASTATRRSLDARDVRDRRGVGAHRARESRRGVASVSRRPRTSANPPPRPKARGPLSRTVTPSLNHGAS